jgi:hypothetical protein
MLHSRLSVANFHNLGGELFGKRLREAAKHGLTGVIKKSNSENTLDSNLEIPRAWAYIRRFSLAAREANIMVAII